MKLLVAEKIEKVYGPANEQIKAVNSLSLSIEIGEFLVIRGESGAGKTTLLSIIGGLDRPSSGTVRVVDADLTTLSASKLTEFRLHNIGFVFQDYCLVRHLTALGNVRLPLLFSNRLDHAHHAETMLERFNMGSRLHHRSASLSRGEQQRVPWARASVRSSAA